MPINYAHYPENWPQLRRAVLERAQHACEGSPRYPDCRARNHEPHPVTGSRVVLTVAHLHDGDLQTQDIARLRAWCNRCHLTYDAPARAARLRAKRLALTKATS